MSNNQITLTILAIFIIGGLSMFAAYTFNHNHENGKEVHTNQTQ